MNIDAPDTSDLPVSPVRFYLAPVSLAVCTTASAVIIYALLPGFPEYPIAHIPLLVLLTSLALCVGGAVFLFPDEPQHGTAAIALGGLHSILALDSLFFGVIPTGSLGWGILAVLTLVLSLVLYLSPRQPPTARDQV